MDTESLDEFERQLAAAQRLRAPDDLRCAVLSSVERELRASRWDRRFARAAAVLLIVGVGWNASLVLLAPSSNKSQINQIANDQSQQSLIDTAIVVAEATNAETGRNFARQMAALTGRELTDQEIATIDAATRDRG